MSEISGLNSGAIQPEGESPSNNSKPSKPARAFDPDASVQSGAANDVAARARLFSEQPSIDFVLEATGEKMSTTPDKLAAFAARVSEAAQAAKDAEIVQRVKREVQMANIVDEIAKGEAEFLKPDLKQIFLSQLAI